MYKFAQSKLWHVWLMNEWDGIKQNILFLNLKIKNILNNLNIKSTHCPCNIPYYPFHGRWVGVPYCQVENHWIDITLLEALKIFLLSLFYFFHQAFYFERDDVALPGFAKFFSKSSKDERKHAERLMQYQNMRGGRIVLQDIKVGIINLMSFYVCKFHALC